MEQQQELGGRGKRIFIRKLPDTPAFVEIHAQCGNIYLFAGNNKVFPVANQSSSPDTVH
jgi:hypothetical protein